MIQKAQIVGEGSKMIATKKFWLMVAIVGFALITVLSSIKTIGTGKVGVVTQFGRVTGRELNEGLSIILPLGLNSVTTYDVKIQKETANSAAASKDLQDINAEIALNYQLERGSVGKVHQEIGPLYMDKVVSPAINEVFKAASAKYTASELITERSRVKTEAQEALAKRLQPYGIRVSELSIVEFKFSDSFSKAIEDKQIAQQNAERAKFNLESAKTDAEAQKAQSETLTQEYLQKQAIEKWDGKMPTYMGSGTVFNIPLN